MTSILLPTKLSLLFQTPSVLLRWAPGLSHATGHRESSWRGVTNCVAFTALRPGDL